MNHSVTPAEQRLTIGLLLAFVGGYLDAFTYTLKGGVFANAQTGNIIFLSLNLAEGKFGRALYFLLPLLAFISGVVLSEYIKKYLPKRNYLRCELLILGIEMIALILLTLLPSSLPNEVFTITISFICAVQFNTFRRLENSLYATTFCTGNLRSATRELFAFFADHDRAAGRRGIRFLFVVLLFGVGVVTGDNLCGQFGQSAMFVCSAVLLIAIISMLYYQRNLKQDTSKKDQVP